MPEATVTPPARRRPALDTTSNAALAERLDRLEAAMCDIAAAVSGVSQAGRWAFQEHFATDADGRVVLR